MTDRPGAAPAHSRTQLGLRIDRSRMRRFWQFMGLVALPLVASAQPKAVPTFTFEDHGEELHRELDAKAAASGPGFAVRVVHRGNVILERFAGLENLDTRVPIGPETRFYTASLGKTFTAAAVLMLFEREQLALSDALSMHVPDLPSWANDVAIYHLLTHTGGIPDYYEALEPNAAKPPYSALNNGRVMDYVRSLEALDFVPGTDFAYSNTGYVLLSEVLERITKRTYAGFVNEHLLNPLGLDHTVVFDATRPEVERRAVGYQKTDDGFRASDYDAVTTGPGGVYATVNDLDRWVRALLAHELLRRRTVDLMFDAPFTLTGKKSYLGMGWFEEHYGPRTADLDGLRSYAAIGMLAGFQAVIALFPDAELWCIVLSNADDLPVHPADVARAYLRRQAATERPNSRR